MHRSIFCKEELCFRTIQETCVIYCCYHPTCTQHNFRKSISAAWHCTEWTLQTWTHTHHGHTHTHPFLALCLFFICCNTDLCCANATVTHLRVWDVHCDEINNTPTFWLYYYTWLISVSLCHCLCHVFIFSYWVCRFMRIYSEHWSRLKKKKQKWHSRIYTRWGWGKGLDFIFFLKHIQHIHLIVHDG